MRRAQLTSAVVALTVVGALAACSGSSSGGTSTDKPQVAADGAGFGTLPLAAYR